MGERRLWIWRAGGGAAPAAADLEGRGCAEPALFFLRFPLSLSVNPRGEPALFILPKIFLPVGLAGASQATGGY